LALILLTSKLEAVNAPKVRSTRHLLAYTAGIRDADEFRSMVVRSSNPRQGVESIEVSP
jgi:hypothetical protein